MRETFIQSKGRWGMFAAIKGRFTNSLHQCRTLFYCYKEQSLDFLKHYSAYVFVGVARSVLRASRAFVLGIIFLLFADDLVLLTSRKQSSTASWCLKFSTYTTSCEDESLKPWLLENGRLLFLVLGESLPQVKELGTGPVTKNKPADICMDSPTFSLSGNVDGNGKALRNRMTSPVIQRELGAGRRLPL